MKVTYVQSKKIGAKQNTFTAAKYTSLVHQLRQCCTGELTTMEGVKVTPEEVYLACPEQITNRFMDEVKSQLFGLPVKVYPLDGIQIVACIKEYKPGLLNLLTTIEDKLTSTEDLPPSNRELLSALKSKNTASLDDFYSDLSFFVGSVDSNHLLHMSLEIKNNDVLIPEEIWLKSKKELAAISAIHDLVLINESFNDVETNFDIHKRKYESKENTDLMKTCGKLEASVSEAYEKIASDLDAMRLSLEQNRISKTNKITDGELCKREEAVDYLDTCLNDNKDVKLKSINLNDTKESHFYNQISNLVSLVNENISDKLKLNENKSKIVGKPYYTVKINRDDLLVKFEFYKERYFSGVRLINEKKSSQVKIKNFLLDTEKALGFVSWLANNESSISTIVSVTKGIRSGDRVSISPHDIFSTGHDIAVYGGAGAGKTTTLQVYADMHTGSDTDALIYISLNRLVDKFKGMLKEVKNDDDEKALNNNLLEKVILLSKGIEATDENIEHVKHILSGRLTLIMDGLDEIYNTIPKIINAISEYKDTHKDAQIIISSRDCVSYLKDIEFLGVTLLPFTKPQLIKFIKGWLNDETKSKELIASIDNTELFDHIKTPLLATITCSLIEKGISAPSTETEIYSERLRLLTGEYDTHKNIDRQKHKGELLRKCATKIAYYMHAQNMRAMSKEVMLDALCSALSESHTVELLTECLDELINPCNVIMYDPVTYTYSFGHFRFQEHLVSEELKVNRNIDLPNLIVKDWWRGALCLYAQSNDFSYLFEDVYKVYGNIKSAKLSLIAMIQNSPKNQHINLLSLLKNYEGADYFDEMIIDDYDDAYSIYGY